MISKEDIDRNYRSEDVEAGMGLMRRKTGIRRYLIVCVHAHVCRCVCVVTAHEHMCTCAWRDQRSTLVAVFQASSFNWSRTQPSRLGCVTSKYQRPTSLCLPMAEIKSPDTSPSFFLCESSVLNSGLQALYRRSHLPVLEATFKASIVRADPCMYCIHRLSINLLFPKVYKLYFF